MDFKRSILVVIVLVTIVGKTSSTPVWTLIHDIVQNNVAGLPTIHQHTEWDFDPNQGKERRVRFEALNGHYGEDLIARLGMGMGFNGPWGNKISNKPRPDFRYA